ncbi:Protein N-acetyltransferase, RimJ/RimL family [Lentzea fradiae]|uniref:Protein N-acetyltransferase, RimJ/RimL family n=1 Tax=Lentzea fradiae TaxID=200378 RepID=A0A1G7W3A7_9PSEU|nr:GNAT family N-acetyltransferase [Lentzea fradiae]SDG66361.1 Protein N-acetyltransferase, RimJ/RimL family [Lentzea fradiae]
MVQEVTLRPVQESDLDVVFEFMRDPVAVHMAAFTTEDPDDRAAFDAHWRKVLARDDVTNRVIVGDGRVVGTIASFVMEGDTEVTYWVDRAVWGQGVAGRALELLLREVTTRPLHARAASDNTGSLKVLLRAGFEVVGHETGHAAARGGEIEETVLRLG